MLKVLRSSPQWDNMVVVLTVDENGGWWDHVAPPNCAEAGVLGVLPGMIGCFQANEVIKLITGIGRPLVQPLIATGALTEVVFDNMASQMRLWVDIVWVKNRPLGLGASRYLALMREMVNSEPRRS